MHPAPRPGRWLALRILLAGVVVVATVGTAVATGIDHEARRIAAPLGHLDPSTERILDKPKPGAAQTILLTGLDHRYSDGKDAKSRSDTMILVRLDPDAKATTMLSLPRDLRVPSLGPPGQDKLNSAWAQGGATKLTKTIRNTLLGTPADPFRINDVISVKFDAFAQLVNYFGCLYAEVDRKYFVPPNSGHAQIDQPAGYQLLCGQAALAYVRFRVQDSDFIREARQANYIAEVRSQIDPMEAITGDLVQKVGKYVNTNVAGSPRRLLALAKLGLYVTDKPTARIKLGDLSDADDDSGDVLTTPQALARARQQFLHPEVAKQKTKRPAKKTSGGKPRKRRAKRLKAATPASLTTDTAGMERSAGVVRGGVSGVDVYAPTLRYGRGAYEDEMTRGYGILGKDRKPKWPSYRIVATTGDNGQYYGVEGTTWKSPPILALATDAVRLGGRTWRVQYDGKNIRRLLWQAPSGTYWITNTLTDELSPKEMYALARSLRKVG
ncbi:LCP family protein [Patulibacter sp. SYSU D01012]|uniref:LCP family protein n=1 Tax=Patulibacter sp. SYSU D01012 TaxID=2817381 RepID=UPI0032BFFB02